MPDVATQGPQGSHVSCNLIDHNRLRRFIARFRSRKTAPSCPTVALLVYCLRFKSSGENCAHLNCFMLTKRTAGDGVFFTMCQVGPQAKLDIVAIAWELSLLAEEHAYDEPPRILFDWSAVTSWSYEASSRKNLRLWKETIPRISRAAFIHDRRWDRQAALLAALLRSANTEALSFLPTQLDRAIHWLTSGPGTLPQNTSQLTSLR
jgi:hypothetical protein